MNIILSIKPKWAELIYKGVKTIEWRKSAPTVYRPGMRVYLYETSPICKVTGYFEHQAFYLNINAKSGRIDKDFFKLIQDGCVPPKELATYQDTASSVKGWQVRNAQKLELPMDLADFGVTRAPQSWCYTKE